MKRGLSVVAKYASADNPLVGELHPSGSQAGICRKVFSCGDFHAACFLSSYDRDLHPRQQPWGLTKGGGQALHNAFGKEEAQWKKDENLFSPALYITVSFVSQYPKTTIYSFSLTTPTQNTTPTFSHNPHLQHRHHQIHYSQMAKQWLNWKTISSQHHQCN